MTDDNLWEFDFDGWTLGEDAMYATRLNRARDSGDYSMLFGHWARMIRHWPFAKSPNSPASYRDLGEELYNEIIERINRGIRAPKRADGRTGGGET